MCGIVGLWNRNGEGIEQRRLALFTDALAHRGPDGNGFYVDSEANLGLGHRRLAIIDTSDAGRQPMSYAGERYWITYNGEIYNFLELRRELEARGCKFQTESDTEVILAAYETWGEACQLRFNGMWAFAIWDRQARRLIISRDRFGVKPLIYFDDGRRFAFASEMKAFLALQWFDSDFDPEMVAAALADPERVEGSATCLLAGLKRLPAGHSLTLRAAGPPEVSRWWNTLDHLDDPPATFPQQAERYRALFLDACRIRMRSDVPIGTALSGGLDSSSIACAMRHVRTIQTAGERLASDWQRAFIATYPGASIDERGYAEVVVDRTGARPVYVEIAPHMYLDYFHQFVFQFEEIADVHLGPWLVHRKQREEGVVVTLDGHGGDEALGGYPWHITAALSDALRALSPRRGADLLRTMQRLELFPRREFLLRSLQVLGRKLKARAIRDGPQEWLLQQPAEFRPPSLELDLARLHRRDALFSRLYVDFHYTQLPMNLRDFDRLSMAHGVEVRSPFMDWRLVAYSFSLPSDAKIGAGYTKRILREALKDILPAAICTRTRKLGFPNLAETWSSAAGQEFLRDSVYSAAFRESSIWDGRKIARALRSAAVTPAGETVNRVLPYVQALHLMQAFGDKRRTYIWS